MTQILEEVLEPFIRLDRDLRTAAKTLSAQEARFLVDSYYAVQGYRIRFGNQIRALSESGEPHELIRWMFGNTEGLEKEIQKALNAYSKSHPVGIWMRSIPGIGPVIASGFLAHIDITKAPYAGNLISYSGGNPTVVWEKGEKRPWNADLKKLAFFLLAESFVKTQNHPRGLYGQLYARRKKLEIEANELGMFAEQARIALEAKRYRADTTARQCYEQGKLPPAHIHRRACRWATKIFLTHLHAVMYEQHYGQPAPKPYVIEMLNHHAYIPIPGWPLPANPTVAHEEEPIDLSILDIVDVPEEGWQTADETQHLTLAAKLARFKRSVAERNHGANGL